MTELRIRGLLSDVGWNPRSSSATDSLSVLGRALPSSDLEASFQWAVILCWRAD